MDRLLYERRGFWLAPADQPIDRVFTVAAGLLPLLTLLFWRWLTSGSCFAGPDAALWGIATHHLADFDLTVIAKVGRPPVYPLLGSLVALVAPTINAALMTVSGAAIVAWSAGLYHYVGRRWGRLAGIGAVLALPTQPGALVNGAQTSAEATFFALLFVCCIAIVALDRRRDPAYAALAGLALAVATLCKPQGVLLLPLACVLPLLTLTGPMRLFLPLLTAGTYAVALGSWYVVTGGADPLLTHVGLAAGDMAQAGAEQGDRWAQNLLAEEYDPSWLQSTALPRPLAMSVVNLDRIAGFLWGNLAGLWWAPIGWVWAGWLDADTRRRRDARILLLCAASFVFALPVYWQERHFMPFLVPASLIGAAGLTGLLGSRLRLARRAAVPLSVLVVAGAGAGLVSASFEWHKVSRASRCDDGSEAAIAVLKGLAAHEEGMPMPRLANAHNALEAESGFTESAGMEAPNPFLGRHEQWIDANKPQVFYLVLYPYLFDKPRNWDSVYNTGMDSRAELIHQEMVQSRLGTAPMMVFRLKVGPGFFSQPRYAARPQMGYYPKIEQGDLTAAPPPSQSGPR